MEAADSLINHTPRQRGAGLGTDTRHDSPDIDSVAHAVTRCLPLTPEPLLAHKCQQPAPPVDSVDNVSLSVPPALLAAQVHFVGCSFSQPAASFCFAFPVSQSVRPSFCLLPAQFNEECCTMTCYLYRKCV